MTKRPNHSRLPLYCFVVFVCIFTATPAEAHLNSTGMGPSTTGLCIFFSVRKIWPRCLPWPYSQDFAVPVTAAVLCSFSRLHGCWVV